MTDAVYTTRTLGDGTQKRCKKISRQRMQRLKYGTFLFLLGHGLRFPRFRGECLDGAER